MSENDQHGSIDARTSVLLVLAVAVAPLRCEEISRQAHVAVFTTRAVLSGLGKAGLATWTPASGGHPELFILTPAGRQAASLMADPKLRGIQREVIKRLERYAVPRKLHAQYAAIAVKYLSGVPMAELMAEFGNYERIQAARHALRIPARTPHIQ